MKLYQISVFADTDNEKGKTRWTHLLRQNCNPSWVNYVNTYPIEAPNSRVAGREAIARAKKERGQIK
jgi:hypothetical protein